MLLGLLLSVALWTAAPSAHAAALAPSPDPGTSVAATVTTTGHLTETFHWTLQKSVSPSTLDLTSGGSATVQFTIAAAKDGGTLSASFDGQVCVTNTGAVPTENLAISDQLTKPPATTILNSVTVTVSSKAVLNPGEIGCYPYQIAVPQSALVPGATYKDTAHVTITNHAGDFGSPSGPSPSTTGPLPTTPTNTVNDSITVDDTNGQSFMFATTGSATYPQTFGCADAGQHINTATIRGTSQSSSATVIVNCPSHIIVKKLTTPSGSPQLFTFNPSYGSSFQLSDGQSNDSGPLQPGAGYSVSESLTAGWIATAASCDNGSSPSKITLGPGQTVTCTFTNTQLGNVAVTATLGAGVALPVCNNVQVMLGDFSATLTNSGGSTKAVGLAPIATGSSTYGANFNLLLPGAYAVALQAPPCMSFTSSPTSPVAITVLSGQTTQKDFSITSASSP